MGTHSEFAVVRAECARMQSRTASAGATAQRGDDCQRRLQRACSRDSGRRRAVVSAA